MLITFPNVIQTSWFWQSCSCSNCHGQPDSCDRNLLFFLKFIHTKLYRWNHQNPKQVNLLHKNQITRKELPNSFGDNKIVFEFLKLVWILAIRAKTKVHHQELWKRRREEEDSVPFRWDGQHSRWRSGADHHNRIAAPLSWLQRHFCRLLQNLKTDFRQTPSTFPDSQTRTRPCFRRPVS